MDERIMELVSLIAGQVCSRSDLFLRQGRIVQSLVNDGVPRGEADAALTAMQVLSRRSDGGPGGTGTPAVRAMGTEERSRLDAEAFGLVVKLWHLGIIDDERREALLDRAMALDEPRIGMADLLPLLADELLNEQNEVAELLVLSRRPAAGTIWN